MSYDILFVPHSLLGTADPMGQLLRAAETHPHSQLTDDQLAEWEQLVTKLRPLLPASHDERAADQCQLRDPAHGIHLARHPAELALSLPAWHTFDTGTGGGADPETHQLLQAVAAAIESVTGLVAYDLQTNAPFVGGASGRRSVRDTGDQDRLDAYVGGHESGYLKDAPTRADRPDETPPSWWRRLFGRG